ncbi:MAG: sigma-70 family RNA polymerase sigma factor, partial [Oscillospiraceae bacterium]|nr:sigma-70 family RNA polymerase sigma factor [Oscillospiraceae bacterium]
MNSLNVKQKFHEIYCRNADRLYRICLMQLKSVSDAEDAVQGVFLKYLKKPIEFTDINHEKAWFIVTAQNYCRDVLKCWWRSRRTDMEKLPEGAYSDNDSDNEIFERLMALPPKYKEVLYLYYYEEYSVKEISELLGRNESTIRTQLAKGREKLKS